MSETGHPTPQRLTSSRTSAHIESAQWFGARRYRPCWNPLFLCMDATDVIATSLTHANCRLSTALSDHPPPPPSMSTRKDLCCSIGIHRAPAYLSKDEFTARMSALADALCAVPVVQKNLVKFDVITRTNILEGQGTAMQMSEPQPIVLFLHEYETGEHMVEVLADPNVQKLVAEAEEFGFQTGGTSFGVNVVTKMQRDTPGTNVHAFGICSAPPQVSAAQFTANFEAFIEKFLELPIVRKNFVKYTILFPQNVLDKEFQSLGLSAPTTPIAVTRGEAKNWDAVVEIAEDPEVREFMAGGVKDFVFQAESSFFASEIITKLSG
ncbi:hypothetical protein MVEN_01449300 [Mycena venus]|uniref:Uncharacterized protein n=1 Tax=Mycena venus TaxID=2733690 RepID=A0A8H6XRZ5_9AGAR|nr:hypothetical protein MVEN_01449300 [Mycena venus]